MLMEREADWLVATSGQELVRRGRFWGQQEIVHHCTLLNDRNRHVSPLKNNNESIHMGINQNEEVNGTKPKHFTCELIDKCIEIDQDGNVENGLEHLKVNFDKIKA